MSIAIIAAMCRNRVIGRAGALPWTLPEDMRRFRELTTGKTLIMGRRTFESIGRPLPERTTIIISGQPGYRVPGCTVAVSLEEALRAAGATAEIFICGGGLVYQQAVAVAERIYLTIIDCELDGDTLFPEIPADFVEISRERLATSPGADFLVLERLSPPSPGAGR
jgi:dihydrofolate reductase